MAGPSGTGNARRRAHPWYDTAHHDRFVLHGAGYPGRYEGGLEPREHGIYSDDYIGHRGPHGPPAMVSDAFGPDVVRKHWLLNDLMGALALKRIESVEYAGGDLHRQHVRWSGGGEVWVNRGESDWSGGRGPCAAAVRVPRARSFPGRYGRGGRGSARGGGCGVVALAPASLRQREGQFRQIGAHHAHRDGLPCDGRARTRRGRPVACR